MAQRVCPQCGRELEPMQTVCPNCGVQISPEQAPPPAPPQPPPIRGQPTAQTAPPPSTPPYIPSQQVVPTAQPPSPYAAAEIKSADSKAVIALVLGIANFVVCMFLWIPALILSGQALDIYSRFGYTGGNRGLAVAGRILGWVGLGLFFVWAGLVTLIIIAGLAGES